MEQVTLEKMLCMAATIQANAYAPYSKFMVGAAVLTKTGNIYAGCNMEGVDYDGTHAEESALAVMVGAGERSPTVILVVGAPEDIEPKIVMPCGKCRQKLYEFVSLSGYELDVVTVSPDGEYVYTKLSELPPFAFGPADLGIDLAKYRR